jgi:hypothetical protein
MATMTIPCSKKQTRKQKIETKFPNTLNLKEDDIVEFVCENARYLQIGISNYHVRFEGRLYTAKDTRDLVVRICHDLGIKVKP